MVITGEYIVGIAVPFVIAILAMAFPLMLGASAKINSQYESSYLAKIFQGEFAFRGFVCLLVLTPVFITVFLLEIPVWNCLSDSWIVYNSAALLTYVSTTLLLVFLLLLARVISIYYDQNKLLHHLVRCYKSRQKVLPVINFFRTKFRRKKLDFDSRDFQAISKLMNFSINNADETLARELFCFFIGAFVGYRKGKEGKEIVYPEEFYNSIFEANELLCARRRKTVSYYNEGTFYELFIDSYGDTKLSQKTIRFLWMCAIQNVAYNKDDYIFALWKKIYQYVALFLDNNVAKLTEKEKFVEFAHMLCSYIQLNRRYTLLRRMMTYTQMSPPNYAITPSSTQMVIDACIVVRDHDDFRSQQFPVYYEQLYPQPGIDDVDAGNTIQNRLYNFYALSFLWQYLIQPTYKTEGYQGTIYCENKDKQKTLEVLQKLGVTVKRISRDRKLMKAMGMDDLNYDTVIGGRKSPKDWFESEIKTLSDSINDQREQEERESAISRDVILAFRGSVERSTKEMLDEIRIFTNEGNVETKTAQVDLGQRFDLQLKSHVLMSCNFIDVCSSLLAADCKANIFTPLLKMKLHRFVMEEEDVINTALAWGSHEGLIIFNFGVGLNEKCLEEKGLVIRKDERLFSKNGIEIVSVSQYPVYPGLEHSFVIVKKTDLPRLTIKDVDSSLREEYGLEKCSSESMVYASVLDFRGSTWSKVKDHYVWENPNDADKYALFCSMVNIQLHYSVDSNVVQLCVYNQFMDKVEPQKPNSVVDVWEKRR